MPTASVEYITPEAARLLLEYNTRNRNIQRPRVSALADKIRSGQFKTTGQAHVIIGSDGVLLNGQHTLSAVVEANLPITTVVSRGVDPAAFDAIDTGMKRTAAQVLAMSDVQDAAATAAAIRTALTVDLMIHTDAGWSLPNYAIINNEDIVAELHRDPIGWSWAGRLCQNVAASARALGLTLMPSPIGTFAFWAQEAGADMADVEDFIDLVVSDEGHRDGQPQTTLRRRLASWTRNRQTVAARLDCVASWSKAWNAHVDGRSLDQIRTWTRRSATFPKPRLAAITPVTATAPDRHYVAV